MKKLFAKKAANTNAPQATEHLTSDERTINDKIDLADLLGVDETGQPYAEIFEMEFDEPRVISFAADTQRPASGPVDTDKFRVYMNFDAENSQDRGQRSVLVAHNLPRSNVSAIFEKWNSMDPQASLEKSTYIDSARDNGWDLSPQ